MKTIIINESSLSDKVFTKNDILHKLPKRLLNQLEQHKTSIGKHPSFPIENEMFDKDIATVVYNYHINNLKGIIDDLALIKDENYLRNLTNELIQEITEIERPIRKDLNELCVNVVKPYFKLNQETLLNAELVDNISVFESNEDFVIDDIEFDSVSEMEMLNNEVYKRRMIHCLINGACHSYFNLLSQCYPDLFSLNIKLPELYYKVNILMDYLSFISDDFILLDDSNLMSNMGISITDTFNLKVEAKIFPLLLKETIKCILTLFSSAYLPQNTDHCNYILNKADSRSFELWDERLGVGLWELIMGSVDDNDYDIIPNIFTKIVSLPCDKFNAFLKEFYSKTKRSSRLVDKLIGNVRHQINYNTLLDKINSKNSNVIDNYLKSNEL